MADTALVLFAVLAAVLAYFLLFSGGKKKAAVRKVLTRNGSYTRCAGGWAGEAKGCILWVPHSVMIAARRRCIAPARSGDGTFDALPLRCRIDGPQPPVLPPVSAAGCRAVADAADACTLLSLSLSLSRSRPAGRT